MPSGELGVALSHATIDVGDGRAVAQPFEHDGAKLLDAVEHFASRQDAVLAALRLRTVGPSTARSVHSPGRGRGARIPVVHSPCRVSHGPNRGWLGFAKTSKSGDG